MNNHDLKLLVFDWDGTLADTSSRIVNAMQSAINILGLGKRSIDEIQNTIGLGLAEVINNLFPELEQRDQQDLANNYRQYYLQPSNGKTMLFPDAEETLHYLKDQGYLMAVATGKSRSGLDRALQETGLEAFFHASRCADEACSKPHPQMLLEIMDILDVESNKTLMIGDSEFDLQMANNAGIAGIAVSHGTQSMERLLKCKPLTCLNRLNELIDWLTRR
ncbi:MAG: HAD-IIIA family hydrolase [Gammaproteobacteria bacterium]|nr:HAD-IIIA family hydrolase [Gammaproteobacteria bacterium]